MIKRSNACGLILFFALAWAGQALLAAPRGADEARQMAQGWLRVAQQAPLHERLSPTLGAAEPVVVDGRTVGYVFALPPRGFIVTSADDGVEPVIAFSRTGRGVLAAGSPLAALLQTDLPQRLEAATADARRALSAEPSEAALKWALFADAAGDTAEGPALLNNGLGVSPADLRVAPLLGSRWGQDTVAGQNCFNYYTPSNYLCGCNGTSWGQIMRYHQYPTNGIGQRTRTILVDDVPRSATTRGGNGAGGPYAWSSMPLLPDASMTVAQRQAIGALTYDIVVASSTNNAGVLSSYTPSNTSSYVPPFVVTGTFGYANTIRFEGSVNRTNAINANLDAGLPVNVALPGHAVACDGYGFQSGTAYHHLNMGWNGLDDAWYALGYVEAGGYQFTGIQYVFANIYPDKAGEVVSGRVLDSGGNPISGTTVTLTPGGRTDVTDSAGVYGFYGVASGSTVTLNASKAGYTFSSKNVSLGTSVNYTSTCGNRWGNDFTGALSGSYRLVSGRIVNGAGNGLVNIEVVFSSGGGSAFTDGYGDYVQALPIGWSGTVTPTQPCAYFEPAAYAIANLQANASGLDFTGTLMRFVKANATGANSGTSWADAYTNLVTALGSTPEDAEVWVAAGTYRPGAWSRDNAFFFSPGQAAYGGFAGTETRRSQRDWRANPAVLSGDIGILNTVTDNCYTVVRGAAGARLDGFTVTGGNANFAAEEYITDDDLAQCLGGGIFVWPGNTIPSTNTAAEFVVDHCEIVSNRAVYTAGPGSQCQGGGVYGCLVRNSLLRGNAADFGGGATYCQIESSTIVSNSASNGGGTLWVSALNSIIYYNTANNNYTSGSFMTNTCSTPLPTGAGNISSAPLFAGGKVPGNGFMIATNSPCKNAGVARPWMAGAQDLYGDSRASGTYPDMGAYELQAAHPAYDQRPESPLLGGTTFSVRVKTRYGWSYRLQTRTNLVSGSWQDVAGATTVGDGTVKALTNLNPAAAQRFYHVLAQ